MSRLNRSGVMTSRMFSIAGAITGVPMAMYSSSFIGDATPVRSAATTAMSIAAMKCAMSPCGMRPEVTS